MTKQYNQLMQKDSARANVSKKKDHKKKKSSKNDMPEEDVSNSSSSSSDLVNTNVQKSSQKKSSSHERIKFPKACEKDAFYEVKNGQKPHSRTRTSSQFTVETTDSSL